MCIRQHRHIGTFIAKNKKYINNQYNITLMHKNIAVKENLHTQIKVAAANHRLSMSDYLAEVLESRHRLIQLATNLYSLEKGDVYAIETEDSLITIKCEEVLPLDRKD